MKNHFEQFILEHNPKVDLSVDSEGNYTDEAVHAAWVGYVALNAVIRDTTKTH